MEINEIAASASAAAAQKTETSHAVKTVEMANEEIEQTGEQVLQLLESATQPRTLRVGAVTTLGMNLDVKA